MDALVGAVDLVDDDNDAVAELERLAEHEARLRHGALGCVDEQNDAVDHLQDTLDLAAEVGVARGVDDVDLRVAVAHGGILGQDRDAALALQIVGVHDTVDDLLMSISSTRVVLPWSTWAMMATFLNFSILHTSSTQIHISKSFLFARNCILAWKT